MTSLLHLEDCKQPHKAKSKTGYSQNAFHRGQYANYSPAANGASAPDTGGAGSGYMLERHEQSTCSRKEEAEHCTTRPVTLIYRSLSVHALFHATGTIGIDHVTVLPSWGWRLVWACNRILKA